MTTTDKATTLRKGGMSYGEIANRLNISRSGAWRAVNRESKERTLTCQYCCAQAHVKTKRAPERCPRCRRYRWIA